MGMLRKLLPISRAGMAWWAYRNREMLVDWASFGARSLPRLVGGEHGDVVAETRLRAALSTNPVTRQARDLEVSVRDGVAELKGAADAETVLEATRLAERIGGIRSIRDATRRGRYVAGSRTTSGSM